MKRIKINDNDFILFHHYCKSKLVFKLELSIKVTFEVAFVKKIGNLLNHALFRFLDRKRY